MTTKRSRGDMVQERLAALTPEQRAALEQQLGAMQPGPATVISPSSTQDRHLPFPLTDIQQAYWAGRTGDFAFGGVATHAYTEIDALNLDLDRLGAAWNQLVARHAMLRAVFLPDGSQRVLDDVAYYSIAVQDLRAVPQHEAEASLLQLRQIMSHQILPSDRWPIFDIRASLLDAGRVRLHLSFDAIIADIASRRILMREWGLLYNDPAAALPPLDATFRDFVLAEQASKSSPPYIQAREYWLARAATLPAAPELPLQAGYDRHAPPVFTRQSRRFEATQRQALEMLAKSWSVSLNILLLTAYADVLLLWARHAAFTLNLTLFNRPAGDAQLASVVGDFTSLTMLEVDMPGAENLAARAARTQSRLWRDLDHRQFSGIEVLREIARHRGGTGEPMMPFVFTSALASGDQGGADFSWMGKEVYGLSQTPQVWVDLMAIGVGDELVIHWNAVEALFPAGLMRDMFLAFTRYLDHLMSGALDSASSWRQIAHALLPDEARQIQTAANATEGPQPTRLLHEPWKDYAAAWPKRPAVIAPERILTHGELANMATNLGRRLRGYGVQPNTLVAVVMHKGWEQIAAVLAILEAGGAYLPIDPDIPAARLHYLLEDANVSVVLTQSVHQDNLVWPQNIRIIAVMAEDLLAAPAAPLAGVQSLSDLAYVIYTSGSAGQPKGVAINHRGAANTIEDINARFSVGPADRVLALSALSFDLSVYDIFGVLAAGGALVMPDVSGLRDPAHWAALIRRHGVTLWNSVPALMELLVDYAIQQDHAAFHDLRLVLLSGDRIPTTLPPAVKVAAPAAKIISLGGATEASIWSIFHDCDRESPYCATVPYGKPLRNQTFQILAPGGINCPVWTPGELHIGGIGLARFYWGDRAKTEAAFIVDAETGARLYRTGDRGRYLPDGSIDFLGRDDGQIKLRGFRVELGEPEAVLATHPAVKDAVVIACSGGTDSERSLAAFIVPHAASTPSADDLTQYLRARLPGYMVPPRIILVAELPLTQNGKIDRRQLSLLVEELPPPPRTSPEDARHTEQIGQLVRQTCRIGIPTIDSNFLDLGLNSIDIIRIVNAIDARFGFRPDIESLYSAPTIRWLALQYAAWQAAGGTPNAPIQGVPPQLLTARGAKPGETPDAAPVQLPPSALPAALEALLRQRRSIRRFALHPVELAHLSALLALARPQDGYYLYASASGLYPVHTYLYAKPGRIERLAPGPYRYDLLANALVPLAPAKRLPRAAFNLQQNAPIFDEAAFALLLVASMDLIEPSYAGRSLHLATLEAGLISQIFELAAPACSLGLCQIGSIDDAAAREIFGFSSSQKILHVLFGGNPDSAPLRTMPPDATEEGRLKRLLQQVVQLSPEAVQALLAAHLGAGK